jgi:hypothetical protein
VWSIDDIVKVQKCLKMLENEDARTAMVYGRWFSFEQVSGS